MYIDIVEKNCKLLLNLFNDILDLSALESDTLTLSYRPIKISDLCQDLYEYNRNKTQYGVELIYDESSDDISIFTDGERLVQIFTNLINNAIKFTYSGKIHFGYQRRDDLIQFYVKDSGIGIAANKIATIFKRFGKVNNFVQGTGLGLTLCRMIVEKMGGRIWVRSIESKGTTFYFILPCMRKSRV